MVKRRRRRKIKRGRGVAKQKVKRGRGIINKIIDAYPFNTTYGSFCGPQKNSLELMQHGILPKSLLDRQCMLHDQLYLSTKDEGERSKADKKLMDAAWSRATSMDAPMGERIAAAVTAAAMKAKSLLGQGLSSGGKLRGLSSGGKLRGMRVAKKRQKGAAFYLKQFRAGRGLKRRKRRKKSRFLK